MNRLTLLGLLMPACLPVLAQQPQIPTLQVCNLAAGMTVACSGKPVVHIPSRMPGGHTGNVDVSVQASCDPVTGFPVGQLVLSGLDMSDSKAFGTIASVHIDQITSTGHDNPTAYMSGECMAETESLPGAVTRTPCHFWILFADTGGNDTSAAQGLDIVSFLVFDKSGNRIAYATGPVITGSGGIAVTPTLN